MVSTTHYHRRPNPPKITIANDMSSKTTCRPMHVRQNTLRGTSIRDHYSVPAHTRTRPLNRRASNARRSYATHLPPARFRLLSRTCSLTRLKHSCNTLLYTAAEQVSRDMKKLMNVVRGPSSMQRNSSLSRSCVKHTHVHAPPVSARVFAYSRAGPGKSHRVTLRPGSIQRSLAEQCLYHPKQKVSVQSSTIAIPHTRKTIVLNGGGRGIDSGGVNGVCRAASSRISRLRDVTPW